jgi:hypothetical protein
VSPVARREPAALDGPVPPHRTSGECAYARARVGETPEAPVSAPSPPRLRPVSAPSTRRVSSRS